MDNSWDTQPIAGLHQRALQGCRSVAAGLAGVGAQGVKKWGVRRGSGTWNHGELMACGEVTVRSQGMGA